MAWRRRVGRLCYNAGMNANAKPPGALERLGSHLQVGPQAMALRWADTAHRRIIGSPIWRLSEVTPQLLLGGQHYYDRGQRSLQDYGITAIVNMRREYCDKLNGEAGLGYLRLETQDNTPPSVVDLMRGVAFISAETERGGKVYVHCAVGCGRAPTMTAAYLIAQGDSPSAALARIRLVRPFINPTSSQLQALDDFAQAWTQRHDPAPCPS